MIDKKILLDGKSFTLGVFDDSDKLLNAVKKIRDKGIKIFDCYTPFPVHHLDKALGYERTNLTVGAFLCGMTGTISGFSLAYFTSIIDWPMIIGGKPADVSDFTSFIPVIFELTILFTAFGMVGLFFWRSRMLHGMKEDILDIRQTSDRLLLAIDESVDQDFSNTEIQSLLKENGAIEVRTKARALSSNNDESETVNTEIHSSSTVTESSTTKFFSADELETIERIKSIVGTVEDGREDDLKLVKGIGPVYEKTLKSLGIKTFEQVTKMNKEAIDAVENLTNFPGRVAREDWIGQANHLKK